MSSSLVSAVNVAGNDPLISFTIVLEGFSAALAVAVLMATLFTVALLIVNPPAIRN